MSLNNPGLKRLRVATGPTPEHKCGNCGCKRYSPCTCSKGLTGQTARAKRRAGK